MSRLFFFLLFTKLSVYQRLKFRWDVQSISGDLFNSSSCFFWFSAIFESEDVTMLANIEEMRHLSHQMFFNSLSCYGSKLAEKVNNFPMLHLNILLIGVSQQPVLVHSPLCHACTLNVPLYLIGVGSQVIVSIIILLIVIKKHVFSDHTFPC